MALIAKKLEGEWVTLKCDPSEREDEKTHFFIKPLTYLETALIQDRHNYAVGRSTKDVKAYNNFMQTMAEMVASGLKDVKNLLDPNGNEVKMSFETVTIQGKKIERVSKDFLDILPSEVVTELGIKILGINDLDEEEKESLNSSSPE